MLRRRAAEQRDERATFHVEHRGRPPLCTIRAADWPVLSLPQLQPATDGRASPWGPVNERFSSFQFNSLGFPIAAAKHAIATLSQQVLARRTHRQEGK